MDTQNIIVAAIAVIVLAVVGFFFFQPTGPEVDADTPAVTGESG